jgi:hypothetical protein
MENIHEYSLASNIFLARGRDVFLLHIMPLTAIDWLYVSRQYHELAFNNLLRDPRVIRLINESRPLSKAVSLNNVRAVSLLLSHPNVNPNEAFSRPLTSAIENGFDTIAEILLNDIRTKISYYFLDICISRKRLNIARLLLKRGIKFEDEINFNRMLAKTCENYTPELAAELLDVYDDKDKININQALEISAICKHEDLAKLLLDHRPANNRISAKILLSMANYRVFDCMPLVCDQAEFIDIDEKCFKELIMRTTHAKRSDIVQLINDKITPFVTKSVD